MASDSCFKEATQNFGAAKLLTPTDLGNEQAPAAARIPHVLVAGCQPDKLSGWRASHQPAGVFDLGLTANALAAFGSAFQYGI